MKLESGGCWDLLGFFFAVSTAVWQSAGEKNDFWVGKMIFLKLETSDCWDLLGFLLFCVVYCYYMADCPEKNDVWVGEIIFLKLESGGCWDLLGFLLLRCLLLFGRVPGKKNIFGWGK